jgi:hypothetical protein
MITHVTAQNILTPSCGFQAYRGKLRDVMKAIDMLGENVRIILAGDFNLPWNEQGRNGQMDASEKKLSKLLNSLCEVRSLTSAWGALHPDKQAWTRQTSVHGVVDAIQESGLGCLDLRSTARE